MPPRREPEARARRHACECARASARTQVCVCVRARSRSRVRVRGCSRLHKGRHPVGLVVVGHEPVSDLLDVDEGARHGAVDKRRVGTPAKRVRVPDRVGTYHAPLLFEELDNVLVGVLDESALELRHFVSEPAVGVERTDKLLALAHHAVRHADVVVLLAKGGRAVHDAGARLLRHETAGDHTERAGGAGTLKVPERRLVLQPLEVCALEARELGELLSGLLLLLFVIELRVELCEARRHQNVDGPGRLVADLDVILLRIDAQREVGRQSPRRGGPRDERGALGAAGALEQREGADDGRVVNLLVVLLHLEVGERRAASIHEHWLSFKPVIHKKLVIMDVLVVSELSIMLATAGGPNTACMHMRCIDRNIVRPD
eukprot:4895792-Pleurochrysis_carterae.AAC.2